jgi:nucleoid-associated protein YgaU
VKDFSPEITKGTNMRNLHRYLTSALAGLMISGLVTAGEVPMNPGHPDRYTVVKGDTLWDISSMFLSIRRLKTRI